MLGDAEHPLPSMAMKPERCVSREQHPDQLTPCQKLLD